MWKLWQRQPVPACSLAAQATGTEAVLAVLDMSPASSARLARMGLCVGQRVKVVRGGDPLIVESLRTRIGLSGHLAARMHVREVAGGEGCSEF